MLKCDESKCLLEIYQPESFPKIKATVHRQEHHENSASHPQEDQAGENTYQFITSTKYSCSTIKTIHTV